MGTFNQNVLKMPNLRNSVHYLVQSKKIALFKEPEKSLSSYLPTCSKVEAAEKSTQYFITTNGSISSA